MKQITEKNKKICAFILIALIIMAGIIVTIVFGFNKELKYQQSQSVEVYVEQKVDRAKIKEIANEVLGRNNMVQTIEIYQDMVSISAKNISEEQKNDIVNKIKENYEFEQTAEDTTINTIAETRIRDMYKKYVLPIIIAEVLVLIYMVIRYYKNGIIKVAMSTIFVPVIGELVLLSIIAITRIPLGRLTPILVIAVYIISLLCVINKNEK